MGLTTLIGCGFIVGCAVLLYSLLQGAPYVPTKRRDIEKALALLNLPKGAVLVDVGAGDGAVLAMAARAGLKAVGIEINPLVWLMACWRLRNFKNAMVARGNMWRWHLPPKTDAVFVFTAGPFAKKLTVWLDAERQRLGHPFSVVSYGFALPGKQAAKTEGPLLLYHL